MRPPGGGDPAFLPHAPVPSASTFPRGPSPRAPRVPTARLREAPNAARQKEPSPRRRDRRARGGGERADGQRGFSEKPGSGFRARFPGRRGGPRSPPRRHRRLEANTFPGGREARGAGTPGRSRPPRPRPAGSGALGRPSCVHGGLGADPGLLIHSRGRRGSRTGPGSEGLGSGHQQTLRDRTSSWEGTAGGCGRVFPDAGLSWRRDSPAAPRSLQGQMRCKGSDAIQGDGSPHLLLTRVPTPGARSRVGIHQASGPRGRRQRPACPPPLGILHGRTDGQTQIRGGPGASGGAGLPARLHTPSSAELAGGPLPVHLRVQRGGTPRRQGHSRAPIVQKVHGLPWQRWSPPLAEI